MTRTVAESLTARRGLKLPTWRARQMDQTSPSPSRLAIGQYTYDAMGRVEKINALFLTYGPDGQIAEAHRGTDSWEYIYDENGQRLAKRRGGQIVAAYWGDRFIDDSGLRVPIRIAGLLSGYMNKGVFYPINADTRGTVFADGGTQWASTPYGERVSQDYTRGSAFLDFVEKGYDADLGLVRMGVRDYDPRIAQFIQPDPLYLEDPNSALSGTADSNLYSYARNNPVNFADPSGMETDVCDGPDDCVGSGGDSREYTDIPSAVSGGDVYEGDNGSVTSRTFSGSSSDANVVAKGDGRATIDYGSGNEITVTARNVPTDTEVIRVTDPNVIYRMVDDINKYTAVENLKFGFKILATAGMVLDGAAVVEGVAAAGAAATARSAAEGVANKVSFDWSRAGHIFREAEGHVNPGTMASQGRFAELFEDVASNPILNRPDYPLPQAAREAGVEAYSWIARNGEQIWVFVRQNKIVDAGINLVGKWR